MRFRNPKHASQLWLDIFLLAVWTPRASPAGPAACYTSPKVPSDTLSVATGRQEGLSGHSWRVSATPPCCLVVWHFRNSQSHPDESGRVDEKGPVRALLRTYRPFSTHVLQNDRCDTQKSRGHRRRSCLRRRCPRDTWPSQRSFYTTWAENGL